MSASFRKQPDASAIDFGPKVYRDPVFLTICFAVAACLVLVALYLYAALYPAGENNKAVSLPALEHATNDSIFSPPFPLRGVPPLARARVNRSDPPIIKDPAAIVLDRRNWFIEDKDQDRVLRETREIDLDAEKGTTEKLIQDLTKTKSDEQTRNAGTRAAKAPVRTAPVLDLIAKRADLKGLPVQNEANCRLNAADARAMAEESRGMRRFLARSRQTGAVEASPSISHDDARGLARLLEWLQVGTVQPDIEIRMRLWPQLFQAEKMPLRLELVKWLQATTGKAASMALAQRAVFDLAYEVRKAAVAGLKDRARAEYRSVLIKLLRYPWPAAADHAAAALVALADTEAVPDLLDLLDKPDPLAPTQDKNQKWHVAELVRVNHFGNCLLCHAPSSASEDPVRGLIPSRSAPIPPVQYYDRRSGNFVRADVTYLRQDFSVVLPVKDHGKWPQYQRFDFLVRQSELSADEVARLKPSAPPDQQLGYSQRESVLWALRELTGKDGGPRSETWRTLLRKQ